MRFRGPRAECDRCGGEYYHQDLHKQMQTETDTPTWTGWLVCQDCLDQVVIRPTLPPLGDPYPIFPPNFGKTR